MTINFPKTTFQILRSQDVTESVDHRVLIVGQKLAGGSATTGELLESIPSATDQIASLFGERAIIAEMAREFKRINQSSEVDALPVDDNAGATQATASLGFSGTASEAGRLFFEVGSGANYRFAGRRGDGRYG